MKGYASTSWLRDLQSERARQYQEYTNVRNNLQYQYKNFCAAFKEASEKFGISYTNIAQYYLSPSSGAATSNAAIPQAMGYCIRCGNPILSNEAFCSECGTRRLE